MKAVLVIVIAYIIGSIPFGYLIVRAKAGADIRQSGSGGTGATNVTRRAGKAAGLLTLLLDVCKGAMAVFLARTLLAPAGEVTWPVALAALAVLVGHIFPVWLGFRGGKGVATGVGVFLILAPVVLAFAAVLFFAIVLLTRYVSLASIIAAVAVPVFVWLESKWIGPPSGFATLFSLSVAAALLIITAHRANIARLSRGLEPRFR